MDFTREPIIESVVTPKEGHKLVVRSSKSAGQEEYFADAVEIISFGQAIFFRYLEKPKAFLVPVSDYEIVEVREARLVLKNAGLDRSIKIGGGREGALKAVKENEKDEAFAPSSLELKEASGEPEAAIEQQADVRLDKKRDRRKHYRKRKGRDDEFKDENVKPQAIAGEEKPLDEKLELKETSSIPQAPLFSSLLAPPPTLISETINRYRENDLFKGAFYLTEEEQYKPHDKVQELLNEDGEETIQHLQEPDYDPGLFVEAPQLNSNEKVEETAEDHLQNGEAHSLATEENKEITPILFSEHDEINLQKDNLHHNHSDEKN